MEAKIVRGMLLGLAVGDALGVPVEFEPRSYLKQAPVTCMRSDGSWGQAAGTWSDDIDRGGYGQHYSARQA